ncbi:hypothetical protein D9M73_249250 [compost metagenome]
MFAQPGPIGAGLASGMRELHAGDRALGLDEASDPPQRLDMLVAPDTQVLVGDPPLRAHRRSFDYHQPGAPHRPASRMDQVPVVGHSVFRRVLAHRRDSDSVGQGNLAQGQGLEQLAHGITPFGL